MNTFHKYTPVRIAVPFCIGILCGLKTGPGLTVIPWLLLSGLSFAGCLVMFRLFSTNYSSRWIPGLLTLITISLAGFTLVGELEYSSRLQDRVIQSCNDESFMICRLKGKPLPRANSFAAEAEIAAVIDSAGHWKNPLNGILLYFMNDSSCLALEYGDMILVAGQIKEVSAPLNPDVFDYRKYLKNRQIRWQLSLEPDQWQVTGHTGGIRLMAWSERSRSWFLEMLMGFHIEGSDLALAAALLLGSKDLLEKDVRQEFSHAGAMHVLCVSGLHVGIMYVIAERLLFFMKKGRRGRKLQPLLILVFIWAYAFITGLSPSVLRAGMMFSLLAAGRAMKRSSINFNILAGAAFIQLLANPLEITQIGFQLSYLAVLGIFAFYQPLNELNGGSNKIFIWVWSVMAVSIAAQASTSPLACHYFMIFPVYFLITNLVVVPLAGIIIYLALGLGVAGAAGLSQEWLAMPLKLSLQLMHKSVETIQSLPGSVIEPILLDPLNVVSIYLGITGVYIMFVQFKRAGLFFVLTAILISASLSAGRKIYNQDQSELVVYYVPGHSAVDLIHGRQAVFLCDSLLADFPEKIDSRIKPHRLKMRVEMTDYVIGKPAIDTVFQGGCLLYPFLTYYEKKIAIIPAWADSVDFPSKLLLDFIIITGNQPVKLETLLDQFDVKMIVIDSSVPHYKAEQYLETCEKTNTPCHSVRKQGAYSISW